MRIKSLRLERYIHFVPAGVQEKEKEIEIEKYEGLSSTFGAVLLTCEYYCRLLRLSLYFEFVFLNA